MNALGLLAATVLAASRLSDPPGPRLYVPNQDDATVSVIDARTRKLIETVDLRRYGVGDNAKPHHVQVEPDGSAWYVTLIGAGKVFKLDRANKLLGSASMEVPGLMTLHPTKDLMFVGRSMSAVNPPPRVAIIRRSDMKVLDEVALLFPRPHGIVIHPRAERIYVASLGTNQIASVGTDGGDIRLIDVPGPAHSFVQGAVSPDGRWLAVTAELTDQLMVFDLKDPAAPVLARQVRTPDGPFEPVFTGDGRWIFVSALSANQVAVIDTKTWTVVDTVKHNRFAQPHGLALSADGRHIFVSNRNQMGGAHQHEGHQSTGQGVLASICAATRKVDTVLSVGKYAAGLGIAHPKAAVPAPSPCR
jgi:YVTN family beta-propeller protein